MKLTQKVKEELAMKLAHSVKDLKSSNATRVGTLQGESGTPLLVKRFLESEYGDLLVGRTWQDVYNASLTEIKAALKERDQQPGARGRGRPKKQ